MALEMSEIIWLAGQQHAGQSSLEFIKRTPLIFADWWNTTVAISRQKDEKWTATLFWEWKFIYVQTVQTEQRAP